MSAADDPLGVVRVEGAAAGPAHEPDAAAVRIGPPEQPVFFFDLGALLAIRHGVKKAGSTFSFGWGPAVRHSLHSVLCRIG